ncbi:MAG TPA: hypothetical protein DCY33_03565 [Gemmatimonadetes bacterium]|nr:hypothetical protein [Gemmatimonadaceae bacterium]MBR44137.1 hypothetical protein [Gemmatimonadota bacterium]MEE2863520.1 hypothetical protein [Gemmatimonadota bacterium]HAY76897.1 hypothetical protein [Gemmatimonadota bacterium]
MAQESRTRLTTVVLLLVVFGTGLLIGFAVGNEVMSEPENDGSMVAAEIEVDTNESEVEPRRRRIYDQVEPNEQQLRVIDSIVTVHRGRTNTLDEEMRAQLNSGFRLILLETREAIKDVLTSEQAAEYQRLLDENDARRQDRENEDEGN